MSSSESHSQPSESRPSVASRPSIATTVSRHNSTSSKLRSDSAATHESAAEALERATSSVEKYPEGVKLLLLLLSIYLAVFLVALDRTIIATALPVITDKFQSFGDVGWYNAAFLLPTTAFQLFFGRLYTFYSPKWIFISLVVVFEAGSALCGAAPNSIAFIWGRVIAGLGAGGIFNGAMILMMYAAPLHKRPMYMGFLGAVFGVASVAGPLLGGVFTTEVSWRWCFYINLPIGAAVLVFLYFVVEDLEPALGYLTVREKISRIDIPGTSILVPCIVCLLLALQWGGSTYPWHDGRIIALLVLFGVLLFVFVGIQIWRQESATVPPRIIKNRTIAGGLWFSFCLGSSFMLMVYYISIWFQAVKGYTAIHSGFATLPFILSLVIASIMSGLFVTKVGYYNPPIITAAVLASIGSALITRFEPNTPHQYWIGVQVLFGFGIGLGLQQTNIAAQTVLGKADAATGISVVFLGQGLGGAISVAIGQNILNKKLIQGFSKFGNVNPETIVGTGATEIRKLFPANELTEVLQIYSDSIVQVFYIALCFACLCIIGALAMQWKSTKRAQPKKHVESGEGSTHSEKTVEASPAVGTTEKKLAVQAADATPAAGVVSVEVAKEV